MTLDQIETMARAYVEAALFTTDTELIAPKSGEFSITPYLKRIPRETWVYARVVCEAFYNANAADLAEYPPVNAGHDLWYTRNGHGCGFWEEEHCTEQQGKRLTASAKLLGGRHLYRDRGWFKFEEG